MTTRNNNEQEQGRLMVGRFGRRAEAPNRDGESALYRGERPPSGGD